MGKAVNKRAKLTLCEIEAALGFDQPKLKVEPDKGGFKVHGKFLVFERHAIPNPDGPLTSFDVELFIPARFPQFELKLYETGRRIPRTLCRHINGTGDCCVTVWEHWLIYAKDKSIAGYIQGPVNDYFLSQYYYEKYGKWPFGERSHGRQGLVEAYAEILDICCKDKEVISWLRILAKTSPIEHLRCPCGSGQKLKNCHISKLDGLKKKIAPAMADRMLKRLQ